MQDKWTLRDDNGTEREFDSKAEAEETKEELEALGATVELEPPNNSPSMDTDGTMQETRATHPEKFESDPWENTPVEAEPAEVVSPDELSENPIQFLESVNSDFVNRIKGTPAISKQGFRFIQREFEISTKSEVVQWSDDPLGCVVWAKAELPGGYSAEAHGEGYRFESDVSDNEFVRYADTRAKNRALSDLTSAGALAVSELQGEE